MRSALLSQDLIFVGGGNTANMLAIWRVHDVDEILREAWNEGIVLCGVSAAAICWFESSVTDSFGRQLGPLHDGLGFSPAAFVLTTTAKFVVGPCIKSLLRTELFRRVTRPMKVWP